MKNYNKYLIIKVSLVIVLILYLLFLCLSDHAKDVPMETIEKTMTKEADFSGIDKCGKTELMRFYGLEESDMEGYFFYKAASPMSVEEILIVKSSSKEEAASILEKAQARLDSQKNTFESYGTDQMALLKKAFVETKGVYTFYMCGPQAASWKDILLSII